MSSQAELRTFSSVLLKSAGFKDIPETNTVQVASGNFERLAKRYNEVSSKLSTLAGEVAVLKGLNLKYGVDASKLTTQIINIENACSILDATNIDFDVEISGPAVEMFYQADMYLHFLSIFKDTDTTYEFICFVDDLFVEEFTKYEMIEFAEVVWSLFKVSYFTNHLKFPEIALDEDDIGFKIPGIIYENTPLYTKMRHNFSYSALHTSLTNTKLTRQEYLKRLDLLGSGYDNRVLLTLAGE